MQPQDVPVTSAAAAAPPGFPEQGILEQMQALSWVDHTALAVLLVFFVIGLFKGLIWQVSRIGILVAAYFVAGRFGADFAAFLARSPAGGAPAANAQDPVAAAAAGPSDTTLYLAYVLLFLGVLIVLSLTAILLQKLAAKAGLTFFDRLGGGLLGVATGACLVLFGLSVVHMFFRNSQLAKAASSSHSLRLSKRAVDWLGLQVPDDLRRVFDLAPLQAPDVNLNGSPADLVPANHAPAHAADAAHSRTAGNVALPQNSPREPRPPATPGGAPIAAPPR